MIQILVTGSNGQLGNEIRQLSAQFPGCSFVFTDVSELDISDIQAIRNFPDIEKIQCIINCAAYTAVDKAETDQEKAMLINGTATGNLAMVSRETGALLIHVSTDYVFDGKNYRPYRENDIPNPLSVYARSKYQGETEIMSKAYKALIMRTSWLYSSFGHNFVKTIMKYGKERGKLNVVFDQIGAPTYAADLARAILEIIPKTLEKPGVSVYHYANEGVASWYDFAKAIIEISGISCEINPIETKDYPLPAQRPFYSVFAKEKIRNEFGISIPYWKDSLEKCIVKIRETN